MVHAANIFIPGRLCLAGEHSDWAALHRLQNASIAPGAALVICLQQGLRGTARRTRKNLKLFSALAGETDLPPESLLTHARSKSAWRYAAGVAHVIHTRFRISNGLELRITEATLPPAKGFSSSAAVCVLVAHAYNVVYGLRLSVGGEMELAYAGERLTGSMCGRMDQIVAIGAGQSARMLFDGEYMSHKVISEITKSLHFVVADLGSSKDTAKILSGLHKAYSESSGADAEKLRNVLGEGNLKIINDMQCALAEGNAEVLGKCMTQWQKAFDAAATPFCPEQLNSPVLHRILQDPDVVPLVYGGKGVGSQGDGSVQFIARDRNCALAVTKVLKRKLGTEPYLVTLGENGAQTESQSPSREGMKPQASDTIHTAVIPAAGFGTRLFPASRSIRPKALFPVVDTDGFAKPLLLCLVEDCVQAGIERVIIVVGPGDQEEKVREVFSPVPKDLYAALKPHMREYADRIAELEQSVEIAVQPEPKGFGHAVSCAGVDEDCPFTLLLSDVMFRSRDANRSCLRQTIDAFQCNPSKSVIGVTQVPVSEAGQYGVVKSIGEVRKDGSSAAIEKIVEKPDVHEAEECSRNGMCDIVLGPYVFTPAVMTQLRKDVAANRMERGEIQLTSAMITVLEAEGMQAVRINGDAFDTGNAIEYARTISKLGS